MIVVLHEVCSEGSDRIRILPVNSANLNVVLKYSVLKRVAGF